MWAQTKVTCLSDIWLFLFVFLTFVCCIVDGIQGYPWIKLSSMVEMLDREGRLDLLLPTSSLESTRSMLTAFWQRWKIQYPDHDIFRLLGEEALSLTIPCKLHGDEGRSTLASIPQSKEN